MLIRQEQLNAQPTHKYSKKQKNIVALSSLIAGVGLTIVACIGYLFYFMVYVNNKMSFQTLSIIATISLMSTIISMIVFSFTKPTMVKFAFLFVIYIFSSGIGFSSLFAIFNGAELLMIFGVAGLTMFLSAILSYILPIKWIGSLLRFSMLLMFILFICSISFVFISLFGIANYHSDVTMLVITIILAFISVSYNIYLFHSMSRMQEFSNGQISNKDSMMMSFTFGFSLLVSIIQLIWIIARLYLYFK